MSKRWTPSQPAAGLAVSLTTALITLIAVASSAETREACADRSDEKHAYFGDLHIHTGLSADAMLAGTTNRPADAYRFARREPLQIRQAHTGSVVVRGSLDRPLDFAAVTDHAENLGAVSLCTTPGSAVYDGKDCRFVRERMPTDDMAVFSAHIGRVFQTMYTSTEICGPDRARCRAALAAPWQEVQDSAHAAYDRCEFTTFVGYEYSPTPDGSKLHHNVIFRDENVMDVPIAWNDVPEMIDFWRALDAGCRKSGSGCDVLAIPHNPNLGNGRMFALTYGGEADPAKQREIARLRSEIEPVVEMFQQKGDSECRNGMWKVQGGDDPFCSFEKYRDWNGARFDDCRDGQGAGALQAAGCVSRLDYTRYALAAGLAEERRIGANPHRFGVIGSTDNHDGTAADVAEWVWDDIQRPPAPLEPGRMSTGGVAGVWAEENTREAIFDAMQRKEIFATSGPRIRVRFFGGWDLPVHLCKDTSRISRAYAQGVPMGGTLDPRPPAADNEAASAPTFMLSAFRDPGVPAHPGTPLQRAQIIKVWAGEAGVLHQAVYDVAGGANGALVDPDTCVVSGPATNELCSVWRDPDYDPAAAAAYYARVLENPSCRHNAYACMNAEPENRPAHCDDPRVTKTFQERAWTSPIWVGGAR